MYQQVQLEPSSEQQTDLRKPDNEDRSPILPIEKKQLISDKATAYHFYRSSRPKPDVPLMVAVHGIRRQAKLQARLFAPFVESIGGALVAPVFNRKRYADYQRLGRHGLGQRSDLALKRILDEVGHMTGISNRSVVMFGYSGGGQFVHRFAMAYPRQVLRMAIAAPGWYTFPDRRFRYPEGIGSCKDLPDIFLDPGRFLQIPTMVLVGEHDCTRDQNLNQSGKLDTSQGKNRIERARRWVRAMEAAAAQYNYETEIKFRIVPGCGHSFEECMTDGQMGRRVIDFLFNDVLEPV
ncbi:MAG: hypothetical protein QNI97_13900 [Desulfobacterales bacterium]|nr:hypothetical protein [Desulfobacterales bacterium]